jgi:hypothetical protein
VTKEEIKTYAKEMIELAQGTGNLDNQQRCNIVQQAMMICGMPFDSIEKRDEALKFGARPAGISGPKVN